jgi:hypothetical protein
MTKKTKWDNKNYDNCRRCEKSSLLNEEGFCDTCYEIILKKDSDNDVKQKFFENLILESMKGNSPIPSIIIDLDMNENNFPTLRNRTNKRQKLIEEKSELLGQNPEKEVEVEEEEDETEYEYEYLGANIKNINDLIELGKTYDKKKRKRHNLNLRKLNKMVQPLESLQKMIGLENIKEGIFQQIIYFIQDLDDKNMDMLHTVIEGPPGVGKTEISKIIAKIYKALGFLKNDKIVSVKRDDLIANYLGQTANKTRKKIEEALGGVLLIDEAYSIGSSRDDSYTKEAIDMLTSYLSEHPHDLVCIVAGYKNALKTQFFSINEGLERRFGYRFSMDSYNAGELRQIFFKIVKDNYWSIENEVDILVSFFEDNKDYFIYNGGDMLTLLGYCKKTHANRLLKVKEEQLLKDSKKKLNFDDIKKGFEMFLKNPEHSTRKVVKNPNYLIYS